MRRLTISRAAYRGDRGSVTVWLALATFVVIMLVGLAVDLTGQVRAQQQTRDVAYQAARAAGQELDPSLAVRGIDTEANSAQAAAEARSCLHTAGVSGDATVSDGGHLITVTASDTYHTKFLSIIGLDNLPVSGHAEARIAHPGGAR